MEEKIKGAWIIAHTNKLQNFNGFYEFENIYSAGKTGILLSAISADKDSYISKNRLDALANASNITKLELPAILNNLEKHGLIDKGSEGDLVALGITSASVLSHVATIYESLSPNAKEDAVIELAESTSNFPMKKSQIAEEIADKFRIDSKDTDRLIDYAGDLGLVDTENVGDDKILFNGNLFRRDNAEKVFKVLDSLSSNDKEKIDEINKRLDEVTCIPVNSAIKVLGKSLFDKIMSIGFYDLSSVSNSMETVTYLTKPTSFAKYNSNSLIDDAFDLTKAFVSSIMYGMTRSDYARGQIRAVSYLLETLIHGDEVGPVKAIEEDYKYLELKGVVKVNTNGSKKGRHGPTLTLLKREIGELALQAIKYKDISENSLAHFPSATITGFIGPEKNREAIRKKQIKANDNSIDDLLSALREGGV